MKTLAIIPAGGTGQRMGRGVPKQYLSLAGVPILVHTLDAFQRSPWVDEIILVVPAESVSEARSGMVEGPGFTKIVSVIAGGKERQDSVRNALAQVREDHGIVMIHDGVRPFVGGPLIERVVDAARAFGAVTVGVKVRDTVKEVDPAGRVVRTVDREGLWLAQTPQAFRREVILAAYERAGRDSFYGTDDASLVERAGMPVRVISGDADNIKITTPEDLERAERIISGRRP